MKIFQDLQLQTSELPLFFFFLHRSSVRPGMGIRGTGILQGSKIQASSPPRRNKKISEDNPEMRPGSVLPHRTFLKVLYFFFTISRFVLFLYFFQALYFFCTFFSSISQIFTKFFSKVLFLYFFRRFCKMNVLLIYDLQGFLYKYPTECLRLQEIGVIFWNFFWGWPPQTPHT